MDSEYEADLFQLIAQIKVQNAFQEKRLLFLERENKAIDEQNQEQTKQIATRQKLQHQLKKTQRHFNRKIRFSQPDEQVNREECSNIQ